MSETSPESPGSPGSPGGGFVRCGDACWPEPLICDECCSLDLDALDPALVENAANFAANFLYIATGRRFGGCPRTFRPCRKKCAPQMNCCGGYAGTSMVRPFKLPWSTDWVNISCGVCRRGCECSEVSEVRIPDVGEVLNVRIDGVDYDPCGMVAVYDNTRIVRVDGGRWPVCQELGSVDGPGTWSITVTQGACVPAGAAWMTGSLMCEVLKGCLRKDDCELPRRLQTLTRQGVTMGFNDTFENLGILRTGIWEIDAWIEQNRYVGAVQATVLSPELPIPTEVTWPRPGDCGGSR